MLDFCLLHCLLTTDSEAMTLHECHHAIYYFSKLLTNTSRFGSAIQVLPSDIGEYLSSFFNAVVVVVFYFYFYFLIEKCFF